MKNFIILWIVTVLSSLGIQVMNKLRIYKDVADKGYKINAKKLSEMANQVLSVFYRISLSTLIVPIFNLYSVFKKMFAYDKNSLLNFLKTNDALEEMSQEDKKQYSSNPTGFNAYQINLGKEKTQIHTLKINDEIGYIESSDIDRFPEITLIQTNAEILRGTPVYAEVTDEIPTWNLIKGKRVRIIENRFGTEKWTKIAFNDDDGVTCVGYVLADNIQADSWSTLQIIGFILVLVTLVLLVIILIVRNRINHE